MIPKPIETITLSDIQAHVDGKIAEGITLDYKETLPATFNDDWKKEFLADVSSLANTSGGDIVYGVVEERDGDGKPTGIPSEIKWLSILNDNTLILTLDNIIRDGLSPRITDVRIKAVTDNKNGAVLLVRVPRSWNAPHMVTFSNLSRFFARNNKGKYQLDVGQIRSAFLMSDEISERIRAFRFDRVAKVGANDLPVPMVNEPKTIIHIIPVAAFDRSLTIDVVKLSSEPAKLPPLRASGWSHQLNYDGFMTYSVDTTEQGDKTASSYVLVFRNGIIEVVTSRIFGSHRDGTRYIPSTGFEETLIKGLPNYVSILRECKLEPPFLLALTLTGVKDMMLMVGARWTDGGEHLIDRDILPLPEVLWEDMNISMDEILKPNFDLLWQAAGWKKCVNYNDSGRWVRAD